MDSSWSVHGNQHKKTQKNKRVFGTGNLRLRVHQASGGNLFLVTDPLGILKHSVWLKNSTLTAFLEESEQTVKLLFHLHAHQPLTKFILRMDGGSYSNFVKVPSCCLKLWQSNKDFLRELLRSCCGVVAELLRSCCGVVAGSLPKEGCFGNSSARSPEQVCNKTPPSWKKKPAEQSSAGFVKSVASH